MKLTKLQKNCVTVLNRIAKMCEEDKDFASAFCNELERVLDEIHGQDGFGTEGQCDPRGDFRNGQWTMHKVESDSGKKGDA